MRCHLGLELDGAASGEPNTGFIVLGQRGVRGDMVDAMEFFPEEVRSFPCS